VANSEPTWQRVSCHPLFAVLLLATVFGAGWAVTSASARELVCLLARVCG
jgi:hypothetical protein